MRKLKKVVYPTLETVTSGVRATYMWTEEIDSFIKKHYVSHGCKWVAERLGAPYRIVQQRALKKFKIAKFVHIDWTDERLNTLREMYPRYGAPKTAATLDLPITAVQKKAAELRCLYVPKYRYATADGYVIVGKDGERQLEHRLVMEKKLGRKLQSHELVHHRDEDKGNNEPDNLALTTRRDHFFIHKPTRWQV